MRTFVYVDSAILNSYVSQMYGGLVTRKQEEALKTTRETDGTSSSSPDNSHEAQLSLPPLLTVKTGTTYTGTLNFDMLTETDSERESIEKIFHDNAIQELIDELEQSGQLKRDTKAFNVGDYVLFAEKYDVFDIDFLSEIFNEKSLKSIMKLSGNENPGVNRAERRANKGNQPKSKEDEVTAIFNTICKVVPYKRMILTKEHFIPIDERFLRETLQGIRLKYGREITILGRITSTPKIAAEERGIIDPRLSAVVNVANSSLFSWLSASAKWILTPIALYFE